jgi:hypothetical protein
MPAKPVKLTRHARFEMKRRGISAVEIVRMIRRPAQVVSGEGGREVYQGLIGKAGACCYAWLSPKTRGPTM